MAIVQLIYLSRDPAAPVSDFWYYDLQTPNEIKGCSPSPRDLAERLRGPGWNVGTSWKSPIAKMSWPSTVASVPSTGIPMYLALVVSWAEQGVADTPNQPERRYWVVQPGAELILDVQSDLARAREEFMKLIGNQVPF